MTADDGGGGDLGLGHSGSGGFSRSAGSLSPPRRTSASGSADDAPATFPRAQPHHHRQCHPHRRRSSRRRSSAISVEGALDLAQLAALARDLPDGDDDDDRSGGAEGGGGEGGGGGDGNGSIPSREALAEFNAKNDARWVDFSHLDESLELPIGTELEMEVKGGEGGVGDPDTRWTRNQRRASSLWRGKRGSSFSGGSQASGRKSGLSFLEGLIEDGDCLGFSSDEDECDWDLPRVNDEAGGGGGGEDGSGGGEEEGRRRVQFGGPDRNEWRDVLSRADMSEDECRGCWYDEIDHETLQMDVLFSVNRIKRLRRRRREAEESGEENGHCCDEEEEEMERTGLCPRGLEHALDDEDGGEAACEALRAAVSEAVFEAQTLHLGPGGLPDVDAVARASVNLTGGSARRAEERGRDDATAAGRMRPKSRLSVAMLQLDVKRAQVTGTARSGRGNRGDGGGTPVVSEGAGGEEEGRR